jgi:hypothetical protein
MNRHHRSVPSPHRAASRLALWPLVVGLLLPVASLADDAAPEIEHKPVAEGFKGTPLRFTAAITDASEVFAPIVAWRRYDEIEWSNLPLVKDGATFAAELDARFVGVDLEYYIEAYDVHGNGPSRVGKPDDPLRIKVTEPPYLAAPVAPTELRVAPLATIGGGAVALLAGLVLYMGASADAAELRGRYAGSEAMRPGDATLAAGAATRGLAGSLLMTTGVLATAGGAAWFFMAPSQVGVKSDF